MAAAVSLKLPAAKSSWAFLGVGPAPTPTEQVGRQSTRTRSSIPPHAPEVHSIKGHSLPPLGPSLSPPRFQSRSVSPSTTRGHSPDSVPLVLSRTLSPAPPPVDHFYRLTVKGGSNERGQDERLLLQVPEEDSRKRPAGSVASDASSPANGNPVNKRPHLAGTRRRETLQVLPEPPLAHREPIQSSAPAPAQQPRASSPARDPGERKILRERIRKAFLETLHKERAEGKAAARERAERAKRLKELDGKLRGRRRERSPEIVPARTRSRGIETEEHGAPRKTELWDDDWFESRPRSTRSRTREKGVEADTSPRRHEYSPEHAIAPRQLSPAKSPVRPAVRIEEPRRRTETSTNATGPPPSARVQPPDFQPLDPLAALFARPSPRKPPSLAIFRTARDPWSILEVLARKLDAQDRLPPLQTMEPPAAPFFTSMTVLPEVSLSSVAPPRSHVSPVEKIKLDYPDPLPRPEELPQTWAEYSVPTTPPAEPEMEQKSAPIAAVKEAPVPPKSVSPEAIRPALAVPPPIQTRARSPVPLPLDLDLNLNQELQQLDDEFLDAAASLELSATDIPFPSQPSPDSKRERRRSRIPVLSPAASTSKMVELQQVPASNNATAGSDTLDRATEDLSRAALTRRAPPQPLVFSPPDPKSEARDQTLLLETRELIGKLEHLVIAPPSLDLQPLTPSRTRVHRLLRSPDRETPTTAVNPIQERKRILEMERDKLIELLGTPGVVERLEGVNLELEGF